MRKYIAFLLILIFGTLALYAGQSLVKKPRLSVERLKKLNLISYEGYVSSATITITKTSAYRVIYDALVYDSPRSTMTYVVKCAGKEDKIIKAKMEIE